MIYVRKITQFLFVVLLTLTSLGSYAAAQTVSNLPFASTPLDGTELLYVIQHGVSKKTTTNTLLGLITSLPNVTSLPKIGIYSILDSGAACNAYQPDPTDDTQTLQAWFAKLQPGSLVFFPAGNPSFFPVGTFCLHNFDLTLPKGVLFESAGMPIGAFNQGGNPQGGGFVHPGTAHLFGSFSDVYESIGVWRSLDGCFHISPTRDQIFADKVCWWNEESQGITFPQVAGSPTSHGQRANGIFVEGFNVGIWDQAAQIDIDYFKGDNTVDIAEFGVGDKNTIHFPRFEPYYAGAQASTTQTVRQDYGVGAYFNGGGAYNIIDMQCEDKPKCAVFESVGAGDILGIQYEYSFSSASSPIGFPAENYGIGIHAIGNNFNNIFRHLNVNSNNNNTTPLVFADGVVIDEDQYDNTWEDVVPDFVPAGGSAFYAGGGSAAPIVEQIIAITAPVGGLVTLTGGGSTLAAVGGPFTVSHKVTASDTPTTVALALDFLWNTHWSAPGHAHVNVLTQLFPAGTFGVYYPVGGNVTVSVTGATTVATNPWVTATPYGAGAPANSGFNIYATEAPCTSGAGPAPTGTSTGISDGAGGCLWDYVSASKALSGSTGILNRVKTAANLFVTTWAPSTAYTGSPAISTVAANGNIYVETAPACTSASGGSGPTGTGKGIADGTCLFDFSRVGAPGQALETIGNMIVLGDAQAASASWQIDGYYWNRGVQPLPYNWLSFNIKPFSLQLGSNIPWSPLFQANVSGGTIGADSFDNGGTITVPGGQTATITFATPWFAGITPQCGVNGGPVAWGASNTAFAVKNTGTSTNSYPWSCSAEQVHE